MAADLCSKEKEGRKTKKNKREDAAACQLNWPKPAQLSNWHCNLNLVSGEDIQQKRHRIETKLWLPSVHPPCPAYFGQRLSPISPSEHKTEQSYSQNPKLGIETAESARDKPERGRGAHIPLPGLFIGRFHQKCNKHPLYKKKSLIPKWPIL